MDASNLLKPALASGDLRCIGSTTYQEYKRSFDRDKALGRRFQRIDVPEPTVEEAVQILNGLKSYYEKHHNVRYTAPAIRAAVDLSSRYINDRYLPDKAIDVMDEAGRRGAAARERPRGGNRGRARLGAHGSADGADTGAHGVLQRPGAPAKSRG